MGFCIAHDSGVKCNEPTPSDFRYCEKHKDRPKATKERLVHSVSTLVADDAAVAQRDDFTTEIVQNNEELTGAKLLERVARMVNRTIDFEEFSYKKVQELNGEIRRTDKMGAEHVRAEVQIYERALDRSARVLSQVTKLGIDAQLANASKAQYEIIKTALMKTLMRLNLTPDQLDSARGILAEEFAKVYKESA